MTAFSIWIIHDHEAVETEAAHCHGNDTSLDLQDPIEQELS